MRDKLLVKVKLPATARLYEFRLPYDLTAFECAGLVSRMLAARESVRYEASSDAEFVYLEGGSAGVIVNPKETIRSLVLQGLLAEGSQVMLA